MTSKTTHTLIAVTLWLFAFSSQAASSEQIVMPQADDQFDETTLFQARDLSSNGRYVLFTADYPNFSSTVLEQMPFYVFDRYTRKVHQAPPVTVDPGMNASPQLRSIFDFGLRATVMAASVATVVMLFSNWRIAGCVRGVFMGLGVG